MDWVANDSCWNHRIRPVITNPNTNVIDAGYRHSSAQSFTLTPHADIAEMDPPQYPFPQLEMTAIRVVGCVHFGINADATPAQHNYTLGVHMRVAVATQIVGGILGVDDNSALYDMGTPWVANEDFLWHYHDRLVVSSQYWADTQILTPDWRSPQKVSVDIRVSRRLKQREVLVLYVQSNITESVGAGGNFEFDPDSDVVVWFDPALRTLVRTIT